MTPEIRHVVLVSCVGRKASSPMPARDLYRSDWFVKARRVAERHADEWWILSAKEGLLRPDRITTPYEATLNKMGAGHRLAWAELVYRDLRPRLAPADFVCFLAGARYREHLLAWLRQDGFRVAVPMERLGIGRQLQWMDIAAKAPARPW